MVQFNGYALGTGPDLLYPVNGEACDWMYGAEGIFAYTPEIGNFMDRLDENIEIIWRRLDEKNNFLYTDL